MSGFKVGDKIPNIFGMVAQDLYEKNKKKNILQIHATWKNLHCMTDEMIDLGTCSNCGGDVPLANYCWECGAELEEDDT